MKTPPINHAVSIKLPLDTYKQLKLECARKLISMNKLINSIIASRNA